jgi:hypothetical protein
LYKGDSSAENAFKTYVGAKVTGALNRLIESGADLTRGAANLFFVQLLEWACDDGNDLYCSQLAIEYYEQWKAQPNTNPIPPLFRTPINCLAVRADPTDSNFKFVLQQFANATTVADKTQLINRLGCRSNKTATDFLLGSLVGTTPEIPKDYGQAVIDGLASNSFHFADMLAFFDAQFDNIVSHIGGTRIMANGITIMSSVWGTQEKHDLVDAFLNKYRSKWTEGDIEVLERAKSTILSNMDWMTKFGVPMERWLQSNI